MPILELTTHRLSYRVDGETGPWLLFSNSLGTDLSMWDAQVAALADSFRIVRYDRRGHGASSPPPPPYSIAELGRDVIHVLDALAIDRAHVCGLSIGGLVGQWLGLHAPERIDQLVLCATTPRIGTSSSWLERIELVRRSGLEPLVAGTRERWFGPTFRQREPAIVEGVLRTFLATDPLGYIGCCAALAEADFTDEIAAITRPVIAVSGADDPVCPPGEVAALSFAIARAIHVSLPGRHLVNIEAATAFNELLRRALLR